METPIDTNEVIAQLKKVPGVGSCEFVAFGKVRRGCCARSRGGTGRPRLPRL